VVGEPQVVIAAKADNVFAIDNHLHRLRAFSDTACAISVLLFSCGEFPAEIFPVVFQ
jgi:hypothetical protein